MNILLINPPWKRREQDVRKKLNVDSRLPSLGLGYIAAMLRENSFNVKLFDASALGIDIQCLHKHLIDLEYNPDYVGITATTTEIDVALQTAGICRNLFKNARIVLGGVHPTVMPEETLADKNVDFVIRGEGEYSFLELVRGDSHKNIQGLSYKENGHLVHNSPRERIKNLDELPFPAFDLMPMSKYHPPLGLYKRLPAINIITARGCPNKCTYCATHTIWGGKMYYRTVGNIIEEIKYLVKNFGIKEISISDDTFTISKKRVIDFCESLLANNINLTWTCNSRIVEFDLKTLKLMKKTGCHHICYGVESANEEILKNINKNISLDKAVKLINLTKRAGITCRASFMLGNPGETEETMRQTLDFALCSKPSMAVFNITTPYPGTPIYKWAKENKFLMDEDWSTYHGSKAHIRLPTLEPEKIEAFQKYAFKKFLFRPTYILSRIFKIRTKYDILFYMQGLRSVLKF